MKVVVTAHAALKLREHGLLLGVVEAAVTQPSWTEPDPRDASLTRYYLMTEARDYRIVGRFDGEDFVLVTLFPDRGARRRREKADTRR